MNEWTCIIGELVENGKVDFTKLSEKYPNFLEECDDYVHIFRETKLNFMKDGKKFTIVPNTDCWIYRFDNLYLVGDNPDENILSVYDADVCTFKIMIEEEEMI